jgi:NAD(P)-dependent dehydrogenase (short-subunit alcohol dehydrogenase family)
VNASTELQSWFGLDGLVAVVTGGSGALGSAISRGLAAAGARVAVLGRNAATLDVAARELHAEGADALAVPTDVLDSKRLRTAAAQIVSRWDRVDILINSAGGIFRPPPWPTSRTCSGWTRRRFATSWS